jgi:hypothetical protein
MLPFALLLTLGAAALDSGTGSLSATGGVVHGIVVDGTKMGQPLVGVDVILRAGPGGELVPVAETKTDRHGTFLFEQVPLNPEIVYLPGANRDGVHYPGRRVRLDMDQRAAHVRIVTFTAVTTPSPLVAARHEIDIGVEGQALKVSETLLLSNPTRTTYVGRPMGNGTPVTLWLSIPKNFDRVTFDKEFFGRRFLVVEHQPVTDIPWLPGEQELRFTYHVPLAESAGRFLRPLDVPSSDVRVRVRGTGTALVSCNLPQTQGSASEIIFSSAGATLPESFPLAIKIGALPFPWMKYARWSALIALLVLAAATVGVYRSWGRRSSTQPEAFRQPPSQRHVV